jgi:hypothetical protein
MRLVPPALALAALCCICAPLASAAAQAQATGQRQATPQDADDPAVTPAALTDGDAPPPFMRRPKAAPRPQGPDLTFATRPAPTEFRGLPWGASLESAKASLGLQPVTDPKPLANTYHRPDEELSLGPAQVKTVAYYFRKGVFVGGGVVFAGEANFFLVKDHLINHYGPGRQIGGRYGWTWPAVNIDLRMHDGMGELRYTYEP